MTTTRSLTETCDRLLDIVGRLEPAAEAAAVASSGPDALTRFAESFIHQNVAEDDAGISLRVVLDGRSASAGTTRVDDEALELVAQRALDAARLRPPDPDWPGLAPPAPLPPGAADAHWDDATAAATPDQRAEIVRAFVDAGPGLAAAGYVSTKGKHVAFANSLGQRLTARSTQAELDGIHRSKAGDGSGRGASVRIADLDGAAAGARAAAKASRQDDAIDIEPGGYEVVLEPGCVANILLFLGYAGFNAKSVADGLSFVHLGEQQFDDAVHLVDDALDPRTVGYPYDAEGTPKRRVELVAHGVTSAVVHDRRTAKKAGVESTGHATGDEASGAIPANMMLEGGSASTDELIASVERGLLVTDFHYTRILDPKTQVVTGLTRNGVFLIEAGVVSRAVKNLRFTQSFVAALGPGKVRGVGNDAQLIAGSQLGAAAHVPSLHLASWNFTGGARG
jgi:predicted Zn-dependent protease